MTWEAVQERRWISGLSFYCLYCKARIEVLWESIFHMVTVDFCPCCGAQFHVDWTTPIEHSGITMTRDEANET